MVNKKPLADPGSGMYLNAGEKAVELRYQARQNRNVPFKKQMVVLKNKCLLV